MNTDTKAVAVNVSKGDIRNGKRRNSEKCMVHHALRRVINDNVKFVVDGYNVIFATERSIALPPFVRDTVGVWDCGSDVAPFSFNLSIPTRILKPRYAKSGIGTARTVKKSLEKGAVSGPNSRRKAPKGIVGPPTLREA